jgi:bacteriocin biosynthesis cyclodehydratase domain-containing protein
MIPSPSPDRGFASEHRYTVHVAHDGYLGARCATLLSDVGVPVTIGTAHSARELRPRAGVVIVLATDRPHPQLALGLDAEAWQAGIPWTSGTMIAHEFRIGPSVIPGHTPCFECWSRRVRSLVPDLDAYDALDALARSDDGRPWFRGQLAPITEQVAALLAAEALTLAERVETGETASPTRLGFVWEGDAVAGALRVRRFARVGVCPRCSAGEHLTVCASTLAEYFRQHPLAFQAPLAAERTS